MTAMLSAVPLTSLVVPLLASAAAWAIAVWALKQADPVTRVLRKLTAADASNGEGAQRTIDITSQGENAP